MKKIILQTEIPCLVVDKSEQTLLEPTQTLELENIDTCIYPIGKNIFPFKLSLSLTSSKFFRFVETEECIYFFVFNVDYISKSSLESVKVGGEKIDIEIGKDNLIFYSTNQKLSLPLSFSPNKYEIKTIDNFCLVLLSQNESQMLFAYNPNRMEIKAYKGRNFTINKNEITFSKDYIDYSHAKEDISLKFEKNDITQTSSNFEFQNEIVTDDAVCFAFLDTLLQRNFVTAKKLLTSSLQETKDEDLISFFGGYAKFFPLSRQDFALIYSTQTKIVHFKMEDKKIADFEIE